MYTPSCAFHLFHDVLTSATKCYIVLTSANSPTTETVAAMKEGGWEVAWHWYSPLSYCCTPTTRSSQSCNIFVHKL